MNLIVLMSTYNGEKYLREQLDSLLKQVLKPDKILIRDDNSHDGTLDILKEYANKYDYIEYYKGNNLGPAKSFFELINKYDNYDYYALCDQDDVWFEDKLSSAIDLLKKEDSSIPLLYAGRFVLTDENLNKMNSNISRLYSYSDFAHSLIYHTSPGCTFVFNNKAREKIVQFNPFTEYCLIHDSIIHKVVTMYGKMILDEIPHMYYRQHKNNAIGLTANKPKEFFTRIRNFVFGKTRNYRSKTAKALLKTYGDDCSIEKKQLLEFVAFYKENKQFKNKLMNLDIFKTHTINDFLFRMLVFIEFV